MSQSPPVHPDRTPPTDSASLRTRWQQLYEAALLELNPFLLPERIRVARHAILDLAEEVMTKLPSEEHRALNLALRTLRALEEVTEREAANHGALDNGAA